MKTLLLILLPFTMFAQEIKVYETTAGVRDVYPTEIIIKTEEKVEVYKTENGVREVTPYLVIETKEEKPIENE